MTNSSFARYARAVFIFVPFTVVLVHSAALNDLFWSQVGDVSTGRKMLIFFFFLSPSSYKLNSRIVYQRFVDQTTCSTIDKRLLKHEITFPDEVLAVFDVVIAKFLNVLHNYVCLMVQRREQQFVYQIIEATLQIRETSAPLNSSRLKKIVGRLFTINENPHKVDSQFLRTHGKHQTFVRNARVFCV